VTQSDVVAFLRSIGCESQASDIASIRFAERVLAADRDMAARYLEAQSIEVASNEPVSAMRLSVAARAIRGGEHISRTTSSDG
jgi:hypothetical protein